MTLFSIDGDVVGVAEIDSSEIWFRGDGDAFTAADPALATQWRSNSWIASTEGNPELPIALDDDGRVVKLEYRLADDVSIFGFTDLDEKIEFASPLGS